MEHSPFWEAFQYVGGWWLFSAAISTMPKPEPLERWYGWLYGFLQLAAANFDKMRGKK